MNTPKAYNELVSRLLAPEEREKFEWVIGSILSGGNQETVALRGPVRSGKTSLFKIVKSLILMTTEGTYPPVLFLQEESLATLNYDTDAFVLVEMNRLEPLDPETIVITTTGERLPTNKYFVLMNEIESELDTIAQNCINLYHSLGEGYYDFQENNR